MKPFNTLRDRGRITVTPKKEIDQSGLVVICHGLGDSAEGFVDVAEHLASQFPHLKFILPTAPVKPVTMNMGMPMPSWYDIVGLDERSNEHCVGIDESQSTLVQILDDEHTSMGLPYHRMVLAGFSQGGALSLYTGMQLPIEKRVAGIVVLSGYLPNANAFRITSGLEDVPILHLHGLADPMVQYPMAVRTQEHLTGQVTHPDGETRAQATNYTLKKFEGVVHTVVPEELVEVQMFLNTVLPVSDDEDCKVKLKDPDEMTTKELKQAINKAGLGGHAVGLMEKSEFVSLVKKHREGRL